MIVSTNYDVVLGEAKHVLGGDVGAFPSLYVLNDKFVNEENMYSFITTRLWNILSPVCSIQEDAFFAYGQGIVI